MSFIEGACGDDHELRGQLQSLLAYHDSTISGLDGAIRITLSAVPELLSAAVEVHPPPRRIGQYDIEELIGEGGMGAVYRARQHHPPRDVALKIMRHARLSDSMLRQFEFEAAVLARLNHPGIAHIHEAGVFNAGNGPQPFFAMELVHGETLSSYIDSRRPDVRERLALFIRICDAVSHAHQKGVIHRDLKPANVLVSGEGKPKVLDFGVARAVDADQQRATLVCDVRQLVGTLPYMSPEQVEGRANHLDTRSDVYSLGVMLYEILSGRLPYDLENKSLAAAARVIVEQPLRRLDHLDRALATDLNTIVGKALEKDPQQRYQSASDLAADVERVLGDEPIMARPGTAWYRFGKFARRNRAAVAAAAVAVIALIGGLIASTVALVEARHEANRASAINQFMADVLLVADPNRTRAGYPFIEVLDGAGDMSAQRFAGHPDIEAEVRHLLGQVYLNLSQWRPAEIHTRIAWELRRDLLGPSHQDTLRSQYLLMRSLNSQLHVEEAKMLARDILEHMPHAQRHGDIALKTRQTLAVMIGKTGDRAAAERELRECIAIAQQVYGPQGKITLEAKNNLVVELLSRMQQEPVPVKPELYTEPLELLQDVVRNFQALDEGDAFNTANSMITLAEALYMAGRYDDAETQVRAAATIVSQRYGEMHYLNSRVVALLSVILYRQRRFHDAAVTAQRGIEIAVALHGDGHANSLVEMSESLPMLDAAEFDELGERCARELHERIGAGGVHGVDMTLWYRAWLVRFLARQGKILEAQEVLDQLNADLRDEVADDTRALICLAASLVARARHQFDEAERQALAAVELSSEAALFDPLLRARAIDELINLYEASGQHEKAAGYQRQFHSQDVAMQATQRSIVETWK